MSKVLAVSAIKEGRRPFASEPYAVNDYEPRQRMEDAVSDTLSDMNLYGPFDTAKEMINALLED